MIDLEFERLIIQALFLFPEFVIIASCSWHAGRRVALIQLPRVGRSILANHRTTSSSSISYMLQRLYQKQSQAEVRAFLMTFVLSFNFADLEVVSNDTVVETCPQCFH